MTVGTTKSSKTEEPRSTPLPAAIFARYIDATTMSNSYLLEHSKWWPFEEKKSVDYYVLDGKDTRQEFWTTGKTKNIFSDAKKLLNFNLLFGQFK